MFVLDPGDVRLLLKKRANVPSFFFRCEQAFDHSKFSRLIFQLSGYNMPW